jgi:hypothetical protein
MGTSVLVPLSHPGAAAVLVDEFADKFPPLWHLAKFAQYTTAVRKCADQNRHRHQ